MISSNNQALDLIVSAIKKAGFKNGKDVSICLDVAANELFKKDKYSIHSKNYISVEKSIKEYQKIINKYKIKSIEDPFAENDWMAWNKLMKSVKDVQIVGDDLYVTNLERLKKGFLNISSNSILIKLNQIGTVSETLDVIKFAQTIGYKTIIYARLFDRIADSLRIGDRQGDGLLAQDRASAFEELVEHVAVCVGGQRHDVRVRRSLRGFLPVDGAAVDATSKIVCPRGCSIRYHDLGYARVGREVRCANVAHAAGSDDDNGPSWCCHVRSFRSRAGLCGRGG